MIGSRSFIHWFLFDDASSCLSFHIALDRLISHKHGVRVRGQPRPDFQCVL